jgi:hypothetical protein
MKGPQIIDKMQIIVTMDESNRLAWMRQCSGNVVAAGSSRLLNARALYSVCSAVIGLCRWHPARRPLRLHQRHMGREAGASPCPTDGGPIYRRNASARTEDSVPALCWDISQASGIYG